MISTLKCDVRVVCSTHTSQSRRPKTYSDRWALWTRGDVVFMSLWIWHLWSSTIFKRMTVYLYSSLSLFKYNKGFLQKNMIFRLFFLVSVPCLLTAPQMPNPEIHG